MPEHHDVINEDIISVNSSVALSNANRTDAEILPLVAPTLAIPDHSDDEEVIPMLNLGHFAFNDPRPLQRPGSPSTAGSHLAIGDVQAPVKRSSSSRLVGDFSDTELKKLVKCVSCDIAWTARKSGAQKLVHIQTCAKKTGLTDDTVRILIRKELENASNDPGPSRHKGKSLADSSTSRTTLLEDVVRDAAPKRKGKRKGTVDALKSVSETRETILGRARELLGSDTFPDDDIFVVRTQAFTSTALNTESQPTQAFGRSRLGQQQRPRQSLLEDEGSDGESTLPPATQAFAPSKLGGRLATGTSGGWGYASESECESSASASDRAISPARQLNNVCKHFRWL
jgi:hypothetical protein